MGAAASNGQDRAIATRKHRDSTDLDSHERELGCQIPGYASGMHPYHTHGSKPHKIGEESTGNRSE